jgi:predicted membrane protein
MKEKLLLALGILLIPIEFELHRLGLSIMNESDTYLFWVGFFMANFMIVAMCLTIYFSIKTFKQIYKQSNKQKNEQS